MNSLVGYPVRSTDHYVPFMHEGNISKIAYGWRLAAKNEGDLYFNITEFVLSVLCKQLKKGVVRIVFFDSKEGEVPAYVEFLGAAILMHVDREVWELAGQGEPMARFIIAHEIGHVLLHDKSAKAFSNMGEGRAKFANENCAEWQADTFAGHFLVPTELVLELQNAFSIATRCSVPRQMAEDRIFAVRRDLKL